MIEDLRKNYAEYRWFFTSNKRLVIGGKSDEQNESLVKKVKNSGIKLVMMHTALPGSPFTFILDDYKKIGEKDLEETAVFTACFSQQWKKRKKKVEVHVFTSEEVIKRKAMKVGTFGVAKKIGEPKVELKLYLKKQKSKLRAVPFKSGNIMLIPGKKPKEEVSELLSKRLKVKKNEILNAIPAGGFEIKEIK